MTSQQHFNMTNTKSTNVREWKAFAENPTAIEKQPVNISSGDQVQRSTVYKETFFQRVINEEGEPLSRIRHTGYTSGRGTELTKEDYYQAKSKISKTCLNWRESENWHEDKGEM